MGRTFTFLIFLFLSISCIAQQDLFAMTNSQTIDEKRYEDIKDSPYLFEEWLIGNIYTNDMALFEGVELNYNGYTGEVEVRKGNRFIELDSDYYLRVEIFKTHNPDHFPDWAGDKLVLQGNIHQKFKKRWLILLFRGKSVNLIKDYTIRVSTKTVEDVGKKVEFKRFMPRDFYYLVVNGELIMIRKKKQLLGDLRHTKELEAFMKTHKIKLNNEADLLKMFEYYDGLLSS